ncbi:MAG: CocE/NonD family hydrolase [Actinomycetota bacterium]
MKTRQRVAALALLLYALVSLPSSAAAAAGGQQYVAMADGTELAVWVNFPKGYDGSSQLPAIFEYDGYDGGGQPSYYGQFIDTSSYVTVHAGVRGAGCSNGDFSLFSEQQAQDGATLVEWIARQSWSNGDVGIYGHSYSATMGLLVAAQRPPHLRALTVDGVMDDLYRDLVYPGGVANSGFPILWLGVSRPQQEHQGATYNDTQWGDYRCLQHVLQRNPVPELLAGQPQESAYVQGELGYEDNSWWHNHAIRSIVGNIEVPLQITGGTQDEQTLSRGPAIMFQQAQPAAKQLLLTNGDHNSFWLLRDHDILAARQAWLDHYVRGVDNGIESQPRVRFFFEGHRVTGGTAHTGWVGGDDFPLPQTEWRRYYANDEGALTTTTPTASGSDTYLSGTHRNEYDVMSLDSPNGHYQGQEVATADGPDQVVYRSAPFEQSTAVAGPLVATVWATLTAPDAEFYVRVADEGPDGSLSLLNRGFLKASHRALDAERSFFDGDVMYRPWHPHTNTTTALVTPGQVNRYDIEVWPIENIFRPGHRVVMIVSAPPVQEGYDTYQPRTAPGLVIVAHDPEHPTNLLVPIVPTPADLGPPVACGEQVAVKCGIPGQIPDFPQPSISTRHGAKDGAPRGVGR